MQWMVKQHIQIICLYNKLMSFKVSVEGEEIELAEQFKNAIPYISDAIAINPDTSGKPIEIKNLSKDTFLTIKKATEIANFNFPDLPKIKTTDLKEVIGQGLSEYFGERSFKQINALYKGAKFLQMEKLQKVIAAVLATYVYYKPTLSDYNQKVEKLKITKSLTAQMTKAFKEKYLFMAN